MARRYFELQSEGSERAARALMWRPERYDGVVRDRSLKGLTDLAVGASWEDSAAHRPDDYRDLAEIRELQVEYVRHRRDSTGAPPGHDMRFVLLGREDPGGRWLVVEIGTGP